VIGSGRTKGQLQLPKLFISRLCGARASVELARRLQMRQEWFQEAAVVR
jgi:hypothetical protein